MAVSATITSLALNYAAEVPTLVVGINGNLAIEFKWRGNYSRTVQDVAKQINLFTIEGVATLGLTNYLLIQGNVQNAKANASSIVGRTVTVDLSLAPQNVYRVTA